MIIISKRSECFFIIICAIIIVTLGSLLVLSPTKSFSEKENRALASMPSFSIRSFVDGTLLGELSDFCSDQFPFREYLTDIKAKCEITLGKRENNGVLLTKRMMADLCEYSDYTALERNLEALRGVAEGRKQNTLLLCVPRSIDVNAERLGYDNSFSQNKLYTIISECGINAPSLLPALCIAQNTHKNEWYTTDHHFTTHGAYTVYTTLMRELGIESYSKEHFDVDSVSHSFLGSSYSRSGISDYTPDSICLYRYSHDNEFAVEYVAEGKTARGFYDTEKLKLKDKYSVFLGGNFSHIRIRHIDSERPKLLLIKDSFANSVIPFLAIHFDLDVIDPRLLTAPIDKTVNADEYAKILILCGADTLATDMGFGKWLRSK